MKNWQKSILFLFFIVLFTIPSVSVYALLESSEESDEQGGVELSATPQTAPNEKTASKTPLPAGVIELSGYKYPVLLFVPSDYQVGRIYPLVFMAPSETISAQENIEYFSTLASRRTFFILAPYALWPKRGDVPYALDQWMLDVKKDVLQRYAINKNRIYLVGQESGAHYAAYLGTKYPEEFSAVALIGQAWDGQFSQLVHLQSDPGKQRPFFIALKNNAGDVRSQNDKWFNDLQKKGYPLHLVELKEGEDFSSLEFKKSLLDWMDENSQSWYAHIERNQKTWKGKMKKGVSDFFKV